MSTAVLDAPAPTAAAAPAEAEKLVIISCNGDLEHVWASMILATTGAAMGKQTTIFFTFWGLLSLVKDDVRITGDNWMQKAMALLNRGGTTHLKLSKMNFAGVGKAMMMRLAKEQHDASPKELLALAKELDVKLVPCRMTMDLMGLKREDLIDGLEEPAGAATALGEAQGAITLFI